mgnify:CR=1 FL=1
MLKAVVDGGRGYSGAEYTMELSMVTADPVFKCSDCHSITPRCRAQAVLTHIFKSGRIVPGSARHSTIIEHTAAFGETNFQHYYPTEWNCSD